jgi:hypothetical protein
MTSRDSMNVYIMTEVIPDDYSDVKAVRLLPDVQLSGLIFSAEAEEFDVFAMLSW